MASNPIPAELAGSGGNNLSLIDFDDSSASATNPVSLGSGMDELSDLFAAPTPATNRPGLGPALPAPTPNSNGYGMGLLMGTGTGVPSLSRPTMSPPSVSATPPASIMLPGTPLAQTVVPNYFGGSTYAPTGPAPASRGMGMSMGAGAPAQGASLGSSPPLQPQRPQTQSPALNAGTPSQSQSQGKDPFADLVGLF